MKHLYFLAGPPEKAKELVHELREAGVESQYIHVMAKDAHVMEALGGRPGTLEEFSDLETARRRGELLGGAIGLVMTVAIILLAEEAELTIGWLLLGTILGATFGFIFSTIVGSSEDHPIFHEYEKRLEQGDVLLAVDVDEADTRTVLELIHGVDPGIEVKTRTLMHVEKMA